MGSPERFIPKWRKHRALGKVRDSCHTPQLPGCMSFSCVWLRPRILLSETSSTHPDLPLIKAKRSTEHFRPTPVDFYTSVSYFGPQVYLRQCRLSLLANQTSRDGGTEFLTPVNFRYESFSGLERRGQMRPAGGGSKTLGNIQGSCVCGVHRQQRTLVRVHQPRRKGVNNHVSETLSPLTKHFPRTALSSKGM